MNKPLILNALVALGICLTPFYSEAVTIQESAPLEADIDAIISEVAGFDQEALECVALNIYHEARGESIEGKMAVAWVTLNRTIHSDYPDDVCSVIRQANFDRNGNPIRHQCSFSWFCDGVSDTPRNQEAWQESLDVARNVLDLYYFVEDPTQGAIMYHADYIDPYWAAHYEQTVTIGNHIFYKEQS